MAPKQRCTPWRTGSKVSKRLADRDAWLSIGGRVSNSHRLRAVACPCRAQHSTRPPRPYVGRLWLGEDGGYHDNMDGDSMDGVTAGAIQPEIS
jgi:hypothetical protein